MFPAQCFEPHTCITEGFGELEMHLILLPKPGVPLDNGKCYEGNDHLRGNA